jgi:2-amino-4-hydroxy-6-hydroxymethyldihydropteridine diphosphokinase / dihydropteroate synthase
MVILGLGCNIGDRLKNLREALNYLQKISDLKIYQVSPVYESDALLPENAPSEWNIPYLNLAISCQTALEPKELIIKLKAIETKMGRATHLYWSPRIIDIDILAWHENFYKTEELHIPHQYLTERPFAMWPLADLVPDWIYCQPSTPETGLTAKEIVKKWGSRFTKDAPFRTRQIAHRIDTPLMIGILNITPDSFSEQGKYSLVDDAVKQAKHLFSTGADIIDIGAESTRPGAILLSPKDEWQRLEPVLKNLKAIWPKNSFQPKISIDTRNPETAAKALEFGIDFLNDVSGLENAKMRSVALESNVKLIFMHHLTIPPSSENIIDEKLDVVTEIYRWAETQILSLTKFGIQEERLIFDVGIGFGKSKEQSFDLIKNIAKFKNLNLPLLVGHSRKSFLTLFTAEPPEKRDIETAVISNYLAEQKVDYLRLHNVDFTMRVLKIQAKVSDTGV